MTATVTPIPRRSPVRDRDFGLLWAARAISDLGSAVTMVALPLVALLVLDASTAQVALVAVVGSLAGAVIALPLGTLVEYRPKRPAMILADLARAAGLLSVPVAAAAGVLTVAQLCVVALVNSAGMVVFSAAGQAHLKALVDRERLALANGRLESTLWFGNLAGPPLGGLLSGLVGAAGTLLVDAASFVASAILVRGIRRPEPAPPSSEGRSRRTDLAAGWRFLLGHRQLRRCMLAYTVFSGTVMLLSPLETVFIVRTLGAQPWQYGLAFGLPCAAGLVGARLAPGLIARWGALRTLRLAAIGRGPWMLLFPLAVPGFAGLVFAGITLAGLLGFAAIHNTALTTYRQLHTPDHLMARATTAWSVTIRTTQPLFIAAGGLLATGFGLRPALWIGAALLAASALPLLGGLGSAATARSTAEPGTAEPEAEQVRGR